MTSIAAMAPRRHAALMVEDALNARTIADGDNPAIIEALMGVCRITGMGFAAVARVTDDRWIAAQVLDKIEFGLEPGGELDVKTTICADIRRLGMMVVIDEVDTDGVWRTHPTPIIYGFKSYVSIPIRLDDGSLYGTLCAIDPEPRRISAPEVIARMEGFAGVIGKLLSARSTDSATA